MNTAIQNNDIAIFAGVSIGTAIALAASSSPLTDLILVGGAAATVYALTQQDSPKAVRETVRFGTAVLATPVVLAGASMVAAVPVIAAGAVVATASLIVKAAIAPIVFTGFVLSSIAVAPVLPLLLAVKVLKTI